VPRRDAHHGGWGTTEGTYDADTDATATMAADKRIHGEVVRAPATPGPNRPSGGFASQCSEPTTPWSATWH